MPLDKELIDKIITVTSKAAISCHRFVGKNDKINADKAATDTMRNEINKIEFNGGRNSKMGEYLGKGYTFAQAKKKFMKNDTVEGADLAIEIAPFVFKKINKRKVPLMISLLEAIVKNKKLKINY